MKSKLKRTIVLILLLAVCLSSSAYASPKASQYISSYSAYVYPTGRGNMQIWFDITGTGKVDLIGSTSIYLYEYNNGSWTHVKTFRNTDYPNMLKTNTFYHSGYLSYSGTSGKYYYANVGLWAEKGGSGDSRSYITASVLA